MFLVIPPLFNKTKKIWGEQLVQSYLAKFVEIPNPEPEQQL